MAPSRIQERIKKIQDTCIGIATGKDFSYEKYENAREDIISESALTKFLPEWLIRCRYGSQFWNFIKEKFPSYRERRYFIWSEFADLQDQLEQSGIHPTNLSVQELLAITNSESVQDAWQKCFDRRENDPEGAITSSRTLVESTCKHILETLGEIPDSSGNLPKLYKQTAKVLNLSPDLYGENVIKQILSGCGTVVEGLASLRNKYGDSHGQGISKSKPQKRHAELAVNLAGTLSSFLIATFEEKQDK